MKKATFRNEVKHFINISDYYTIINKLKHVAKQDKYSNTDGRYIIRSLYFDNYNNKALMEKLHGLSNREKFRIRFYNNNLNFLKLEKKSKTNKLCQKVAVKVSEEECKKIIDNDIEWLMKSHKPLLRELYIKMKNQFLKPRTVVEYTREAYIFPAGNVRITIDTELKTSLLLKDFLNPKIPRISVDPNMQIILEVKYDEFLPDIIRDIIQTNDTRKESISKYVACRIYG
ncbi:MAG: polyphosphate polymerase domain-containing protein [Clostridiales bacterium]